MEPKIYLTGALTDDGDPFAWHDELQNSDGWDATFVNPYTLNEFDLGDDEVYERPSAVVEPAIDEIDTCDGLLVRWNDDAFLVGSAMEVKHAFEQDIPVVIWYDGWKDNVSPWLSYHSKATFEDRDKALTVLLGFTDTGFDFS